MSAGHGDTGPHENTHTWSVIRAGDSVSGTISSAQTGLGVRGRVCVCVCGLSARMGQK